MFSWTSSSPTFFVIFCDQVERIDNLNLKLGGTSLRSQHLHKNVRWFVVCANFLLSFSICLHFCNISGSYRFDIICLNFWREAWCVLFWWWFFVPLSSVLLWWTETTFRPLYPPVFLTIKMKTIFWKITTKIIHIKSPLKNSKNRKVKNRNKDLRKDKERITFLYKGRTRKGEKKNK